MMRAAATTAVVAGTATAVSGRVARRQQAKADAAAPDAPPPPPEPIAEPAMAPAPGGLTPEAIDQLKSLGELNASGVLTDEEFAAEKAKILAG